MEMEIGESIGKEGYADNLYQKSNELILIVFRIQIIRSMKLKVHRLTAQLDVIWKKKMHLYTYVRHKN